MSRSAVLVTFVAVSVAATLVVVAQGAFHTCVPCYGMECEEEPVGCLFGFARNACGKKVCAAGPGEPCGGFDNHLGSCGEGMNCKCGKCVGCSVDRLMKGYIACKEPESFCQ